MQFTTFHCCNQLDTGRTSVISIIMIMNFRHQRSLWTNQILWLHVFSICIDSTALAVVDSPIFATAPLGITFHFATFSHVQFIVSIARALPCVIGSNENSVFISITSCGFSKVSLVGNSNEGASIGNDRRMTTQLAALNLRDILQISITDFKPRENFVVTTRPSH